MTAAVTEIFDASSVRLSPEPAMAYVNVTTLIIVFPVGTDSYRARGIVAFLFTVRSYNVSRVESVMQKGRVENYWCQLH
jgi:hypothetical protein